jgi:hypothetical protein
MHVARLVGQLLDKFVPALVRLGALLAAHDRRPDCYRRSSIRSCT